MKNISILISILFFISCETGRKNTTDKPVTTTDLRNQRPTFPGFTEMRLDVGDSVRYLRVVLNNNKLVKTWMVYFDRPKNKWITLTWIGQGENNKILVDTTFKDFIGIQNIYDDPPTFYVSTSADDGKTWNPLTMSLAAAASCKHTNLRLRKMGQLIVSNDFFNDTHLPSVTYIWQWNYDPILKGEASNIALDISKLCEAVQEIKIRVPK